jgi:hypothetical protein
MRPTARSTGDAIHHLAPRRGPLAALRAAPDGPEAARFRQLRAHLRRHGDPQVIALRGLHRRAGVATVAANLALAFAEGRAEAVALLGEGAVVEQLERLVAAMSAPHGAAPPIEPALEPTPEPTPEIGWWRIACAPRLDLLQCTNDLAPSLAALLPSLRARYRHVIVALPASAPAPPDIDALLTVSRWRDRRIVVGPREADLDARAPGRSPTGDRPGDSSSFLGPGVGPGSDYFAGAGAGGRSSTPSVVGPDTAR